MIKLSAFLALTNLCFCAQKQIEKQPHQITQQAESEQKKLLAAIKNGVVMINVNAHLSTERGSKNNWIGSGFLVDKENGIVVTNKHVAGEMAVCTYEIKFSNGSKVSANFLYSDPHYDIAFLRVAPAKIPANCQNLKLSDEEPKIHTEIFAMGNSFGEEFSTFKGTIFSIYDNVGPFNEQSFRFSGMTVGGASGSPVFNKNGEVIGILYGGKFISGAALPISYVTRALSYIKKKKFPPRDSIGAIWTYQDIDLLLDAGLLSGERVEWYKKKFPESHNKILVIGTRIVKSSAKRYLQAGDILWSVNGEIIGPNLKLLENHIDGKKTVILEIYRAGKLQKFSLETFSLQTKPPTKFVSFGGCVFYENTPLQVLLTGEDEGGVYICSTEPTSAFKEVFKNSYWSSRPVRILKIDNFIIKSIQDLKEAIKNLKNKKIFSIHYRDYFGETIFGEYVSADRQSRFIIVKYDSNFDSPKFYQYNPKTLHWDVSNL